MLPSSHRLAKERAIKKVLARGRSFFSPLFKIKLLANNSPVSRFALVVSTRVSKKATKRNLLRRRGREIIRLNLKKIKPGYDVIINLSPQALTADYKELEKQLLTDFKRLKLLI